MRLMNGQFDESSTETLLAGALPKDVQAIDVSARVVLSESESESESESKSESESESKSESE